MYSEIWSSDFQRWVSCGISFYQSVRCVLSVNYGTKLSTIYLFMTNIVTTAANKQTAFECSISLSLSCHTTAKVGHNFANKFHKFIKMSKGQHATVDIACVMSTQKPTSPLSMPTFRERQCSTPLYSSGTASNNPAKTRSVLMNQTATGPRKILLDQGQIFQLVSGKEQFGFFRNTAAMIIPQQKLTEKDNSGQNSVRSQKLFCLGTAQNAPFSFKTSRLNSFA